MTNLKFMKMLKLNWFKTFALGCAITLFAACDDDSDEPMAKGDVEFEITDAPSDDPDIEGVFVTVTGIMVEGELIPLTKQTIDLKTYQEGNTKLLGTAEQLDAKTYSGLTLILDTDTDASGNAPGCYVLTQDGTKHDLNGDESGNAEISISEDWEVAANTTTAIVMDFDLRKSISYADDPSISYRFVNDNDLRSAIRVVEKDEAGTIKGTYTGNLIATDKVIVYAYKEGEFNAETETEGDEETNLRFANAITSAEVDKDLTGGTFTLALLEKGDYELHFVSYKENLAGQMTFDEVVSSETMVDGEVADIVKVESGTTIDVTGTIDINL